MSLGSAYFGIAVHEGKIGILDIGSNSVRLVVYDGMKRAPMPVFNEKAMCELGKNMAKSGKLHPDGVIMAREAIARFLAIAQIMDVVELYIIATAAIRDAEDGKAFVKEIEQRHNVKVKTISGKQEAKLAAKGVQASLYQADGLVGDLGGGSFELVRLQNEKVYEQESLPLGSLRLKETSGGDREKAGVRARELFAAMPWLKKHEFHTFYAVGGSFRNIANIYMLRKHYPLEVLHAYTVDAAPFQTFLRMFIKMNEHEIALLPAASRKRSASLTSAAIVLSELIEHCAIKQVVFSTAGIREGYLFDQLSPYLKQEDALIAGCVDLASQHGRVESYPRDLFQWMAPLFEGETEKERRLRFACCILSEFAWRIHPQYRAEWQFTRIIQSSLFGLDHHERVCLALALYHRHNLKTELNTKVLRLASEADQIWCQLVGQALSLGFSLSGGMSGALLKTPLLIDVDLDELFIDFAAEVQDLESGSQEKKLEALSETFIAWRSITK